MTKRKNTRQSPQKAKTGKIAAPGPQKPEKVVAGSERPALAVAESMAHAAALLNVPKPLLARAKREGCPAFRGARVHLDEFREWMDENGDLLQETGGLAELDVLDRELKALKLRRETREEEAEAGKFVLRKEVVDAVGSAAFELRSVLQARLEYELSTKLIGLDGIKIREVMAQTVDELCQIFHAGIGQWLPEASEWFYEI